MECRERENKGKVGLIEDRNTNNNELKTDGLQE